MDAVAPLSGLVQKAATPSRPHHGGRWGLDATGHKQAGISRGYQSPRRAGPIPGPHLDRATNGSQQAGAGQGADRCTHRPTDGGGVPMGHKGSKEINDAGHVKRHLREHQRLAGGSNHTLLSYPASALGPRTHPSNLEREMGGSTGQNDGHGRHQ